MFPHRLPTILLAAGLLLSGMRCNKGIDPPPPAPVLEGSWNYSKQVITNYDGAGVKVGQTTQTFPQDNTRAARYITYTGTTYQIFYGDGTALSAEVSYTRSGNTISVGAPGAPPTEIKQIGVTELVTSFTTPGLIQGSHSDIEVYCTRR